jgi:exonuclease III
MLGLILIATIWTFLNGGCVERVTKDLRIVSWNVNGVRKFNHLPAEIEFWRSHDLVLLQETFSNTIEECVELREFMGHHSVAVPGQGRRGVWGLKTLFKTRTFAEGFWERLLSPCDWILISRWSVPGQPGLLVVNVYLPVFTRYETKTKLNHSHA